MKKWPQTETGSQTGVFTLIQEKLNKYTCEIPKRSTE